MKYEDISGGFRNFQSEINAQLQLLSKSSMYALAEAGNLVLNSAKKNTPVDWGNLRDSGYVIVTGLGNATNFHELPNKGPQGTKLFKIHKEVLKRRIKYSQMAKKMDDKYSEIGFTMPYAPFVHELRKWGRYKVGSWKFLERAFKENEGKIRSILKRRITIE